MVLRSTLNGFEWGNPVFLYGTLLIPLLFLLRWLFNFRFTQKLDVAFNKKQLKWHPSSLLRFVPDIFLALSLLLMLIAMARPQETNEKVEQWTEGIDIMLVIDISESMQIEDFKPNRLKAAKSVAGILFRAGFRTGSVSLFSQAMLILFRRLLPIMIYCIPILMISHSI